MILRYHLQLTTYDGSRVIVSTSVGSSTFLDDLDSSELREFQHNCGFCLLLGWNFFTAVVVQHSSPPTLTGDGIPYIVSIFAESLAGNGTKCNVTDFTDELGESC